MVGAGGLMLSFNWLQAQNKFIAAEGSNALAEAEFSGYIIIKEDNTVVIFSQNPEIGQNIKTSMPMIVAEELDANWDNVQVEQAGLDSNKFKRQVAGGSQSIHQTYTILRKAGATARLMLINAAAKKWKVSASELQTESGFVLDTAGNKLSYGELTSTVIGMEVPQEVKLKDPSEFKIIGKSIHKRDDGR